MNNKIKYIIAIGLITLFVVSNMTTTAIDLQDKTCYEGWLIPGVLPLWICNNPDGGMDHSFLTYEAMYDYYTPPMEEYFINPEPETYLYTVGNMRI